MVSAEYHQSNIKCLVLSVTCPDKCCYILGISRHSAADKDRKSKGASKKASKDVEDEDDDSASPSRCKSLYDLAKFI